MIVFLMMMVIMMGVVDDQDDYDNDIDDFLQAY